MRHGILLAAAAVLAATACTAQQQNPVLSGSSHAIGSDGLVNAQRTSQTTAMPWTAYRTFYFAASTVDVSGPDIAKVYEIVAHLKNNPSFDVGIDGTFATEGGSDADRTLASRREASVRRALMDAGAGVASYKIFTGTFADPHMRSIGQIQVLVRPRTGSLKAAL